MHEEEEQPNPMERKCPVCGAMPGVPCRNRFGRKQNFHEARAQSEKQGKSAEPPPKVQAKQPERKAEEEPGRYQPEPQRPQPQRQAQPKPGQQPAQPEPAAPLRGLHVRAEELPPDDEPSRRQGARDEDEDLDEPKEDEDLDDDEPNMRATPPEVPPKKGRPRNR